MSVFICVHGELYSKCKWCYDFEYKEDDKLEEKDEPSLLEIANRMKKEKIEY